MACTAISQVRIHVKGAAQIRSSCKYCIECLSAADWWCLSSERGAGRLIGWQMRMPRPKPDFHNAEHLTKLTLQAKYSRKAGLAQVKQMTGSHMWPHMAMHNEQKSSNVRPGSSFSATSCIILGWMAEPLLLQNSLYSMQLKLMWATWMMAAPDLPPPPPLFPPPPNQQQSALQAPCM